MLRLNSPGRPLDQELFRLSYRFQVAQGKKREGTVLSGLDPRALKLGGRVFWVDR
jgi:hypothetical protein